MDLGLSLGYWGAAPPTDMLERVAAAEALGFGSVWTAEAYGSDAIAPLSWLGSHTKRVRLGTSIAQMSARTPTATAMAALTLDHLSEGRFTLGLGASGPQVVEGWYGQPYRRPLERTREYFDIVRSVLRRERLDYQGRHFQIPRPSGSVPAKSLRSTVHPRRPDLPLLLAAEGPRNVALAAEIADGWIPLFYSPFSDEHYRKALASGFEHRDGGEPPGFEIVGKVTVAVDDDLERAADQVRPTLALYIGGMGAKGTNFHYDAFARMGFERECETIQDLYLAGHKKDAIASVPLDMVEKVSLIGSRAKIVSELPAWTASLLTTLVVSGDPRQLEFLAA